MRLVSHVRAFLIAMKALSRPRSFFNQPRTWLEVETSMKLSKKSPHPPCLDPRLTISHRVSPDKKAGLFTHKPPYLSARRAFIFYHSSSQTPPVRPTT